MPLPRPTPQADMRRDVMRIVRDILEIEADGGSPEDSFYDFGGTSLQAMRICARIHQELGTEAFPEDLFESESIAGFVDLIAEARASG